MSVLQEYEMIRRSIGEKKYADIQEFLKNNQQYLLSDVYYKEHVWKEMEEWNILKNKKVLEQRS